MTLPGFQEIMLPMLASLGDGKIHAMDDVVNSCAKSFDLSAEEVARRYPNGRKLMFKDRADWARTYLLKAELISAPSRGRIQVTTAGSKMLNSKPKSIDIAFLMQIPSFAAWKKKSSDYLGMVTKGSSEESKKLFDENTRTPQDMMLEGYEKHTQEIREDIIQSVKKCSPVFFENLVVDLVKAMGYGGFNRDAGKVTGKSGDEGIDGIIKEDKLGLEVIPLQAKRWNSGSVGEPEVQKFMGALHKMGARKGIFITTSTFTDAATRYAEEVKDYKIILIDGEKLADLMYEHNVGVSIISQYSLKQVDNDYFSEGDVAQ